ncbi:large-conductance mechanosensitive channel [Bacteroidia bacterium]|nr:large-conductance mechanosensitive channel [Bacteroidia bacterium]
MFKNFFAEFKDFAQKGSAIDMAVGVITGAAMNGVVNSLVKDIIMPPIGLLLGDMDLSAYFWVLSGGHDAHFNTAAAAQAAGATTLNIGLFVNSLISFIITLFAIFMFVKMANKLRTPKAVTTRTCPYCQTTISMAATKCPNCCSGVKPMKPVAAVDSEISIGGIMKKIKKAVK